MSGESASAMDSPVIRANSLARRCVSSLFMFMPMLKTLRYTFFDLIPEASLHNRAVDVVGA